MSLETKSHSPITSAEKDLHIRPAILSDAAVLAVWDEKPHVQAAVSNSGTSSFDTDWIDELGVRSDGTEFFIAELHGVAIGALQIIDPLRERTGYWGPIADNLRAIDIWIGEEQQMGKGYGTRMMRFAINHAFLDKRVNAILIDPLIGNIRAHRFYEGLGFEFMERRQFDADSDCLVFRLSRQRWDQLGLQG